MRNYCKKLIYKENKWTDDKDPTTAELYWLHVAEKEAKKENERLIIIMHKERVGLLRLDENCSMIDAVEKMQKMFGIADESTLENRGCDSQTTDIIKGASKISQIKFDQYPKGLKVIRLELI